MFTWRVSKKGDNISSFYINNITELINSKVLSQVIEKYNITLYFSIHHMFKKYKSNIKLNKYIKYINQNQISDCLTKCLLLITDFSSVIFDMIYQKKPYIMYIPDINDKNIEYIYEQGYYDIINGLKNESIYFENKCYSVNETVNKIIYYISNNFNLDSNLLKFYESFELNCKNNTQAFINYLINI